MGAEIENKLSQIRQKRGLSAAHLAGAAGISRQTVYAIEAGSYVPNTALALKLARVLEVGVEDLFSLAEEAPPPELPTAQVTLLPGDEHTGPGQPVQLCLVDKRMMASAPSAIPWHFPASDAVVSATPSARGKTEVRIFQPGAEFQNRILVAGCDPAISVLARYVHTAGIELVFAHRNSSQALELLKQGAVHVAGTHLRDEATGESNLPAIARMFRKDAVAVVSFAIWEEGILTARGNPKAMRSVADFARADVSIVNREPGAGSRLLLDAHLERAIVQAHNVRGYDRLAPGHLAAAWQVQTGAADACIATRAAARMFGLAFIPLASERYDLAIRKQHLDLPGIQALLDTLGRSGFRREVESLGGYDTRAAGERRL